ncbi:MAG: metallophosphoesterase, partial [Candidatus Thermoplasmatota archaeon]|nr:metallophosphoesterase [Candidatus Thermoplasmatota archaeon]
MQRKILDLFTSRGILLTSEAGVRLLSMEDPVASSVRVADKLPSDAFMVTLEMVEEILGPPPPKPPERQEQQACKPSQVSPEPAAGECIDGGENNDGGDMADDAQPNDLNMGIEYEENEGQIEKKSLLVDLEGIPDKTASFPAKKMEPNFTIDFDISGCSTSSGEIQGFQNYFRDRHSTIRDMLRRRSGYGALTKIGQIDPHIPEVRVVGMVKDVSVTKNGNKILELEDETGVITIILHKESPLINMNFVNDEVIAVTGKKSGTRGGLRADEIIFPDIPMERESKRAESMVSAAFCSDIHVGSTTFLPGAWRRLTEFLRGNGRGSEQAGLIKYLVVAGDLVDGIGIYPNQEEELLLDEIGEQYKELARMLSYIPEHIELIVMPGNHDAVRPAEPQPALGKHLREMFTDYGVHARFHGNPCSLTIEGLKVLAYHGRSMDDLLSAIPGLSYEQPLEAMKVMLQKRHLAPIYGAKTPLAPEEKDYMIIREIPDIFVTGHVHSAGMNMYRNV